MIHYEKIHKEKVEFQIQQRYRKELDELRDIGFNDLHHSREVTFPFSALIMCWVYPSMRSNGEIFRIETPLRYVLFNPLVYNYEYDSYAHVFGLGVKFFTLFSDKTVLATTTYDSRTIVKPNRKIYHFGNLKDKSLTTVWKKHQQYIEEIEKKGRETVSDLSLENFEFLMKRDDKATIFGR